MYSGKFSFDFLYPHVDIITWSSYHFIDHLMCQKYRSSPTRCPKEVTWQVALSFKRYLHWLAVLFLDRQVSWIAFDGGLVKEDLNSCVSFNSVEAAKRSARLSHSKEHKTVLNIDLIMSSDNENFAMHSETSFGPIHYGQPIICSPSMMTMTEILQRLCNLCLSDDLIHKWFNENSYRSYASCDGCSIRISSASAFLTDIVLKDKVSIIFDLKLSDIEKQEAQAQQILSLIHNVSKNETDVKNLIERVGARYFAVGNDGSIITGALPSQLQKNIILMQKNPCIVY